MATQQDVIKAFMRSLDNTTLSGADALDEAIRNSSGGRFSDMQDLIDSFISDVQNYGGNYTYYDSQTEKFLKDYCGIILGNDDTGAISGSDAGGTVTKTAESIVVESGSLLSYPSGGSTTINGLTFHWPDRSSLGSDEQAVADRIYSWWAKGALELIQESFGLNFMEAGTSVKEISIEFYTNANESILASVNHRYSSYTGKATRLTLSVNMYYYAGFNRQDVNGAASNTSFYLDRTLAHEFVHAVMAANIDHFHNLPKFVKEGLAELVHGIDDERTSRIRKLATNSMVDYLKSMFTIRGTYYDCGSDSYAGGYMLFRYLAKQAANSDVVELPSGVYYNADKTAVTIVAPFVGIWDALDYAYTVQLVDASQETNNITIKAGSNDSTIKAGLNGSDIYGQGGDDTIYGGTGKDIFWYGNGDGHDVICDFQSSTDILCFYDTAQLDSVTTDGTNVILKSGNGSVTLTDRTNKRIYITDTDGKNMGYYFGRQDKANTFVYAANRIYYGSVGYRDTLQVNKGATVSLANTTLYHDIDTLDARKSKKAVKLTGGTQASKLYGSAQNDKLTAGSGGASLIGGKGNDTLYGGAGTDKFYWGSGLGDDVVYNYEISKDIIAFSSGSLKSGKVSGSDVILTSSGGNTIKIKNAANKEIVVANTKGTKTRKTYLSPGVTYNTAKTKAIIKAPYSGTWDAAKFADSIRTIDASKETNKITIKAGNYNNTIKAGENGSNIYGQGGNDKIYGGAKKDVFWYGTGDGTDTIYNFQSGTDVLRFYNEAQIDSVTTSGTSVILKSGTGSVKLVGMTNQRVDITDNAGKNTIYYFGRQDKANTFVYAANRSYYGSTKYKDTLQVNTGATVSLANKTLYHDIDTLDARNSKKAVKLTGGTKASKLYGSAKSDKLVAGSGGASLIGGMGNDTLYGGKGKDKFYWGANLGNDKIYNYTSGKDILVFGEGSLESGMVSGQDVVLTSNTGNTVTIKKAAGKAITIQGTDGVKVEKIYNVPTTDTSLPAGVTYDSNTLTVKISNGTIDSFSLEGNDVIFKSTVGDIRIADGKDKILSVVDGDGVKATYKVSGNIPTGTEAAYNDGNTEVILGENTYIKYIFDINEDVQTVRTGNATASKKDHCILWGSIHDDVLIAGSGEMELYGSFGNDTLYGGSGKNDFGWSRSFGNDVVYNYTTGQDRIKLESNRIESYTVSGNDVILKSGNATLTVKDVKPGDITVYNDFSDQYDTYWYDGKLPDGVTYDSAKNQYILSSFFGNRNYLVDMASLPDLTASLDATAVNSSHFSIYGDERDNTIIASRGGGYIQTGSGCDTVYFGDGRDSLGWGHFYGAEITVYGYKKGQDAIELGYGDTVTRYEINGNDLVMWNEGSYWKSKLTLKDTQLSDVTVLDSYGKEVTAWQQNAALLETSTSACAVTTEETLANGNESLAVVEEKKECLVTLKEAGISEDMGSVSADTTSLYLDDDKTYVDHDSMLMESVSQNQADLAAQKLAQDMVAYSNEMNSDAAGTLLAGNAVTTQGLAPVGENGPLYAGSVKKDDFLSSK